MEQPSTGYDFEVIGDMAKDFECPICMFLLREAVELPCAHVFCKACMKDWNHNAMENDATFFCPSCKKVYQREQIAVSKFLDRFVKTSLQVKCKENKSGCQWEGKIIDYTQHEEKCVYQSINCTFVGCKETMIVMDQAKHELECMYRSVQCKRCLSEMQFINLLSHYGNCTEFPVNCPNEGCSFMSTRKEVCNHTQNECPYQMMNCKYKPLGCKHKFQRKLKNQHQIESSDDHMDMLLDGFNMMSQELSSVKQKLQETEEKLANNDQNLKKTNAILIHTQEELKNRNQDLLVADEEIKKIRNHDKEIDELCLQLVRHSRVKTLDVIVGLKNLATMDYNEIPRPFIEIRSDLHKMVDPKSYADNFFRVMNMMETYKLYKTSEIEFFVKVDFTNRPFLRPYFEDYSFKSRLQHQSQTIYSSENVLLWNNGIDIQLVFNLPGWNYGNADIYSVDPKNGNSQLLHYHRQSIGKRMMTADNMILVKALRLADYCI